MKVLVCGSRTWTDADVIGRRLSRLPIGFTMIVGDAKGADSIARNLGWVWEVGVKVFRADWEKHGKRAGIIRNLKMLDENPDLVIAFWDGQSRGTAHTISEARKREIPTEIILT